MAFANLFLLIDDIATILDDVALMTKVAAKKTAGVLGDDLALNAQQVNGVASERELPVIWAVAKGSLINKAILVPLALLISFIYPPAIPPLLAIGGIYLCFEGVEKIYHNLTHKKSHPKNHEIEVEDITEKDKINGAIRTDFILSAEIIVITLGTVANAAFLDQVFVLTLIAIIMTIGVYGLVAGIVKIDDLGVWLSFRKTKLLNNLGKFILMLAPWLMRSLSIIGTVAMFLVGGGILIHSGHIFEVIEKKLAEVLPISETIINLLLSATVGILAGIIVLIIVTIFSKVFKKKYYNFYTLK